MQTLKTIVATAVITLAATTVALAGAGKMDGQSPSAVPMQAAVAHQQAQAGYKLHLTDAQIEQLASALGANAKAESKHERHVAQHQGQNAAQRAYAGYCAPVRDGADHSGTRAQTDTSRCTQRSGSSGRGCDRGYRDCGGGCD